jgi:hypothetical protein
MDERTFKIFLKKLDLAQVEVEEAAEEAKAARSVLSAIWKDFKKQGGKPDTMRAVMSLRKMDEGDLLQFEEDRRRYAEWMKLPIGAQPTLFDAAPQREADDEDEEEETHAAPPPVPPMTARARRGAKGPKLVEPENTTGSPLN